MASRTEELFVLPPPVGAGIHSRAVKGARPVELSCTIHYEGLALNDLESSV